MQFHPDPVNKFINLSLLSEKRRIFFKKSEMPHVQSAQAMKGYRAHHVVKYCIPNLLFRVVADWMTKGIPGLPAPIDWSGQMNKDA